MKINKLILVFGLLINLNQFGAEVMTDVQSVNINSQATKNILSGIKAYYLGDSVNACKLLTEGTDIFMDNYHLWIKGCLTLGKSYYQLKNTNKAIHYLRVVIESHKMYSVRNVVNPNNNDKETPEEHAEATLCLARLFHEKALETFGTKNQNNTILACVHLLINNALALTNSYLAPFKNELVQMKNQLLC